MTQEQHPKIAMTSGHFFADVLDRLIVLLKMQEQVPDWELAMHQHLKNQFVVCLSGLVTLETPYGIWILPPNTALWIPAFTQHKVKSYGYSSGYVLFIDSKLDIAIPDDFQMYHITDFLKAILKRAADIQHDYVREQDQRLMSCLLDEILGAPKQFFYLAMPQDPRLKKISDLMLRSPEKNYLLAQWANLCCMSERSMTRLFQQETGMSINQWRKKLHVILALQWLSEGESVQRIAYRLCYDSDTSFIVMFKKMMKMSPKKYLKYHLQDLAISTVDG